jgi:hypothetical protein
VNTVSETAALDIERIREIVIEALRPLTAKLGDTAPARPALTPERIHEIIYADLAPVNDYAVGAKVSPRTVWKWIGQGLPVVYIGPTPFIAVSKSRAWHESRKSRRRIGDEHTPPRPRGRPATRKAT